MSCADMILDSVGVAKLDEVNLSDMVVSGVIFPEFTWLLALVHLSLVELKSKEPRHILSKLNDN